MISDSRKAQRNSFAHHRAMLLFTPPATGNTASGGSLDETAPDRPDAPQRLTANVRAGLHGFRAPRPATP